jgi:sulfite reductase (NADPH) flavoprotein alpha-component
MRLHGAVAQLFVSSIEYECLGRLRKGVCTSYLAERVALLSTVPAFVHAAGHFHLPNDPNAAVIMVGAGTGVAPFRAFLEDRRALGSNGRSWLFYGQRHRATGYYYRDDWLDFLRTGVLTQLDTAFSHDQPERIYVQHRMLERAPELWTWLRHGAHVYLCGAARTLAPGVDAALEQIAAQYGYLSPAQAAAFVQTLRETKRYRRDVY